MNFIIQFFYYILYQPLANLLILLYAYLPGHDFGLAIIVLTLLVKIILHPLSIKGLKSQKSLAVLQPKLKEIQQKHKNDLTAQNKATMELYKREGVSPFSGCLPLLIQLPIIIALYQVFLKGFEAGALNQLLYSIMPKPETINLTFLWIFNLKETYFVIGLALLCGFAQFWQAKMTTTPSPAGKNSGLPDFGRMFQTQMVYFFPIITVFIVWKFGAAIGLYWLVSTAFSIGEQWIVNKNAKLKIKNEKPQ